MNYGAAQALCRALEAQNLSGDRFESLNIVELRAKMNLRALTVLDFGGNQFGDAGTADLCRFIVGTGMRLEALDLTGNKISERGVEVTLNPIP
jgi:hypothetical protein